MINNGYLSPNAEANICYSGNSENCSWIQNMLFLINLSTWFVSINFIERPRKAYAPGFLIEIIARNILFLLGLFINLVIIGYMISIMISYLK